MIDTRLDLRESHENRLAKRDAIERLNLIASHLPEQEYEILRMRYEEGMTYPEISEVYGRARAWARKRTLKYEARMKQPGFRIVLTKSHLIPEEYRDLCEEVFVKGATIDQIADRLNLPTHQARKIRPCADAIIDTIVLTEQSEPQRKSFDDPDH